MSPAPRPDAPRVVVTGVGVVSAWGWGREEFWHGLASGETAIADFSRIDHAPYRTHVAGEVPPPPDDLADSIPDWRHLSWADRFAVAAAREALAHAGLLSDPTGASQAAVFFGSSTGGMLEGEEWYRRVRRGTIGGLGLIAGQQVSAPGDAVARTFGCTGAVETISSACASGTLALGRALDAVRLGECDLVLAGGADSLCRVTYGGFNSLRSVDEQPCRPFRGGRAGLSIGEGGAVLVVESAEHAAARGVRPLVELLGAGATSDASHMTAPQPGGEGAARALARALDDAGTAPDQIAFVNAHGTGTPLNDAAEWRALSAVFGDDAAARLPVSATKGAVGHLLGSAGAIEAAATVLSLVRGSLPPTPGEGDVDPESPVDLVRGAPRMLSNGGAAVSLNLAFGGCNAAVVFAPCGDRA
ncbi:MAG TPA: beta-ketoacyl-[acyl-carrier-protein] synthase family protein [Thermoanaerobaculia bacterium]|nr:beta-ketoacyl-[acyl-carrier-protein] synthase family protein [Thermoanaerobaculia bacterium]